MDLGSEAGGVLGEAGGVGALDAGRGADAGAAPLSRLAGLAEAAAGALAEAVLVPRVVGGVPARGPLLDARGRSVVAGADHELVPSRVGAVRVGVEGGLAGGTPVHHAAAEEAGLVHLSRVGDAVVRRGGLARVSPRHGRVPGRAGAGADGGGAEGWPLGGAGGAGAEVALPRPGVGVGRVRLRGRRHARRAGNHALRPGLDGAGLAGLDGAVAGGSDGVHRVLVPAERGARLPPRLRHGEQGRLLGMQAQEAARGDEPAGLVPGVGPVLLGGVLLEEA